MHAPSAVPVRKARVRGLIARLGIVAATGLFISASAHAQKWFDVPPRRDHPNISIRIAGIPDSRQPSGSAKGKMEMRYAIPQNILGLDGKRRNYNRTMTDVVFDCNQALVGFLAATSFYMNDELVDAFGEEIKDDGKPQFVRFPENSPQMKALQAACA
ncbi:hypothetical protein ACFWP0_17420 [Achromobacter sp. NPDC058515]|uniref:hypothetical protein n=1 Tax=Achromobacter sp. NPDC058515 TaxID=3346533 RepID=UPI00365A5092